MSSETTAANPASNNEIDIDQQDALARLGYMYLQHHHSDKAIRLFTGLYKVCPENIQFVASLACAHLQRADFEGALALANEAQALHPNSQEVLGLVAARALLGLNRADEAREQLAQLSRHKPNEVHAK